MAPGHEAKDGLTPGPVTIHPCSEPTQVLLQTRPSQAKSVVWGVDWHEEHLSEKLLIQSHFGAGANFPQGSPGRHGRPD